MVELQTDKEHQSKRVSYIRLSTVVISIAIGVLIGVLYARWHWTTAAEYYHEMKHQYNYCPYCGEYIGEK